METYFRELSDTLCTGLAADEVLLLNYQGEASDFVRLNRNRVRQAGHVLRRSLSLDLLAQWRGLEASGQFRFTPPTHALVAFHQALLELEAEGGIEGRARGPMVVPDSRLRPLLADQSGRRADSSRLMRPSLSE